MKLNKIIKNHKVTQAIRMVCILAFIPIILLKGDFYKDTKKIVKIIVFNKVSSKYSKYKVETSRFIAHGGGEIDNNQYTNSLEALNLNYKRGFRLFELDISITSDGKFVAVHEWEQWKTMTSCNTESKVSLKQFLSYKILNKYTPLDMMAINNWFDQHKDAILVSDKINNPTLFANAFIDKSRLMMELFDENAVDEGLKAGILSAMPSQSVVQNMSIGDVQKLANKGVKHIVVSRNFMLKNQLLMQEFKKFNIKTYVYGANYSDVDEEYMVKYEMDDFYGIYAEKWSFK